MANLVFDFLHSYETGERRESEPASAYQYDEGHVLEAVLPEAVTSCEIHYWIRGQEKSEAYTPGSITQNADGSCTVTGNIPNLYFETNGELRVYIVVTDGDASITTYEGYVHICQRSMPENYVDDDPENEATRVLIEAQTAAATATAAAETCEEVLESIPEDYSQLSDDVENLKDGLSDIATISLQSLTLGRTVTSDSMTVPLTTIGISEGQWCGYAISDVIGDHTVTRIQLICRDSQNVALQTIDYLMPSDSGYFVIPEGTINLRITVWHNTSSVISTLKFSFLRLINDGAIDYLYEEVQKPNTTYNNLADTYTPKYTSSDLSATSFTATAFKSWNILTFFSNAGNLEFNIDSTQTVDGDFRIQYYDGTWHTHIRTLFSAGTTNTVISVDCASLEQYQSATNFRMQLILNGAGSIDITSFAAYEKDNFTTFELYDPAFKKMMANVFQAISNAGSSGETILTAPNGSKFGLNVANDGTLFTVPIVPDKMLILGNSIVFGFQNAAQTERFGMAATRAEYDFANQVIAYTQAVNPNVAVSKLYSSPFEHSTTSADAQAFITNNLSYFANDINLVIIEMGDNVNTAEKRAVFVDSFPLLLETIRSNCPRARIMLVGIWFNNGNVFKIMTENAQKYGCTFVDIRGIRSPETQGELGATVYFSDGTTTTVTEARVTHPGNLGMEKIAEAIETKLGY